MLGTALLGGLVFALFNGLLTQLFAGVLGTKIEAGGINFDLITMIPFLMGYVGVGYGGKIVIMHVVLRRFLHRAGHMPWNYVHFLDYAADRLLLRKVGGGYMFIHRTLLDYFANLEGEDSEGDDSTEDT